MKVLSRPSSQGVSYRVVAVPPLVNLETSSSKSNVLQTNTKASPKVTAVTLSRVETVQKAGASQAAVSSSASKPRSPLAERAKSDSEDDEIEDEIDANIKLLSGGSGPFEYFGESYTDQGRDSE